MKRRQMLSFCFKFTRSEEEIKYHPIKYYVNTPVKLNATSVHKRKLTKTKINVTLIFYLFTPYCFYSNRQLSFNSFFYNDRRLVFRVEMIRKHLKRYIRELLI